VSLKTGQFKILQRGGYFGRYLPSGHLVYVHQGALLGVKFDVERLEVRGTPVPLVEAVASGSIRNKAYDLASRIERVRLSGIPHVTLFPTGRWPSQDVVCSGLRIRPRLSI
jgi:hypothetical protein